MRKIDVYDTPASRVQTPFHSGSTYMDAGTALKGSILRSYITAMRERNIFETIHTLADDDLRTRMEFPPVSIEWVPATATIQLSEHLVAAYGSDYARTFALEANRTGILTILRPLIQGALLVGGATPHTLFARVHKILRAQSRGYEFVYAETGITSGSLIMTAVGIAESRASVVTWEGGLELVFSFFPCAGTVRASDVAVRSGASCTRFDVQWRDA